MGVEELLAFNLREWPDLNLWIGEQYLSVTDVLSHVPLTTRSLNPREWVAPIHYNSRTDAAVRHRGMVVYHRREAYEGGGC